jgi:hypothetical protein
MNQDPEQLDLPPALADALRSAYSHHPDVPTEIDTAVLTASRERFGRRRRMKLMARWGTGLAAGLAAMIVIIVNVSRPGPAPTPTAILARGDVNADGQVNMVDALALAKRVAANTASDQAWDVNRDGNIDTRDVDAIAAASVNLKQPGLANTSLPKLEQLGIAKNVGLASAGVASVARGSAFDNAPLAKASPAKSPPEVRQ